MRLRALGTWSRPSHSRRPGGQRPASRPGRVARRAASRTPSAARNFAPRVSLPRIGLPRQTEYALAEHVLVDLGGTTLDRVRPAAQHPSHLEGQRRRIVGGLTVPCHRVHAEQRDRQRLDALVQLALVHLADRALGPGRPARPDLPTHALVGPGADALLGVDAYEILPSERIAAGGASARQLEEVRGPQSADSVDPARALTRHHLALARQRRARDAPAVPHLTDSLRVGDPGAVEEHLDR